MVQRHFGGDGLDATKLVVEEPPLRTAVRLGVAVEIERRWVPPAPLEGEGGADYLRRCYGDRLGPLGGEAEAEAFAEELRHRGRLPAALWGLARRRLQRWLPPWRLDAVWAAVEEAAAGLPTPASRLCLACVVLQRFEYARVEYGTPVGGQAVEALMMALQQAALDSKHGVGVTAEDRLQDLIIRAAPPKRMTLFLAGQVSPEALAPGDGSPLADSLVDQVEVYPRCRVGRQADAETVPWPSLGEAMEGAWGVCLRLRFAGEENDEAWRRAERHASSKVLPPPFELRAHRGDGGWLEVACGLAEPPMHMALREVYVVYKARGVRQAPVQQYAELRGY